MNRLFNLIESEVPSSLVLEEVIKNKQQFIECDAYHHPYGFNVFKLMSENDLNLRLHIWSVTRNMSITEFKIHDHIYSFTSIVLKGSITHTTYELSESGKKYRVFNGTYATNESTITPTDQINSIIESSKKDINKNEKYTIKSGQLHLVEAANGTVGTILATRTDGTRSEPLILGDLSCSEPITFHRKPLDFDEKVTLMDELLSSV